MHFYFSLKMHVHVASFPGLPTIQFLMACIMYIASDQKLDSRKAWEQGHMYIVLSRCANYYIEIANIIVSSLLSLTAEISR